MNLQKLNSWHIFKQVISNLSWNTFQNESSNHQPCLQTWCFNLQITSPHLKQLSNTLIQTLWCVCVVTQCGAEAPLLLFPVTIGPVFHKQGHDLLMHVFKKFMNWSRPERRWSCSNHSSLVLSSEHTGRREQAGCRHLKGFCSKHRYRPFKIKKRGISSYTQWWTAQNKTRMEL